MTILTHRNRRMRKQEATRLLMRESYLSVKDLIYPIFILEGENIRKDNPDMDEIQTLSLDNVIIEVDEIIKLGILTIILFPIVKNQKKSLDAKEAYNKNGLIQKAIRKLKAKFPEICIITDVALDPFTTHGQDGVIDENGYVLNDKTVEILTKQALSHAEAGADIVAPSDMMDGRVKAIREELEINNFVNTKILSYSAKYASAFYNPFRDIIGSSSALAKKDKKSYQMDPANLNEAIREVEVDIKEGADIVMIKPGIHYLDVITKVKEKFAMPTFVYHVSGEYAMLKMAVKNNMIDEKQAVMETMICFKRAGADAIITYYAKQIANWLKA